VCVCVCVRLCEGSVREVKKREVRGKLGWNFRRKRRETIFF